MIWKYELERKCVFIVNFQVFVFQFTRSFSLYGSLFCYEHPGLRAKVTRQNLSKAKTQHSAISSTHVRLSPLVEVSTNSANSQDLSHSTVVCFATSIRGSRPKWQVSKLVFDYSEQKWQLMSTEATKVVIVQVVIVQVLMVRVVVTNIQAIVTSIWAGLWLFRAEVTIDEHPKQPKWWLSE